MHGILLNQHANPAFLDSLIFILISDTFCFAKADHICPQCASWKKVLCLHRELQILCKDNYEQQDKKPMSCERWYGVTFLTHMTPL